MDTLRNSFRSKGSDQYGVIKMENLIEYLSKRAKEKRKEEKKLKDKFNSLSLVERDAYENIVQRRTHNWGISFLIGIPKGIIWLGIFTFVLDYLFLVDITVPMRTIVAGILSVWGLLIIVGCCGDLINMQMVNKLKRKLLNNK